MTTYEQRRLWRHAGATRRRVGWDAHRHAGGISDCLSPGWAPPRVRILQPTCHRVTSVLHCLPAPFVVLYTHDGSPQPGALIACLQHYRSPHPRRTWIMARTALTFWWLLYLPRPAYRHTEQPFYPYAA